MRTSWLLSLSFVVLVATAQPSGGDNVTPGPDQTRLSAPPSLESITQAELPAVFRKAVPDSIEDLQTIESYTTRLVPSLKDCTVNLRVGAAQGSGVIVDADGLILSAAHVVSRPGRRLSVVMQNGDTYRGIVLGRNATLDAAMVQIDSERHDWPHCEIGTMDSIALGDWCIVLGHPGGYLEGRGLVTRLGRVVQKTKWFLQSDCELVGGDSGGPIFDMRGRLIGISTRIGEETTANFHVPISAYHDDWDRLLASEDFRSHSGAYVGISGNPVENGVGLKITNVYPNTPAANAGLRQGDILVTVEAKKITDTTQLSELVGEFQAGEVVKVEIVRDGQTQVIEVRLGLRFD